MKPPHPKVFTENRKCMCGCQSPVESGKHFRAGHDRKLVFQIIIEKYGSVINFAISHGYPKMSAEEIRERLNEINKEKLRLETEAETLKQMTSKEK